MITKFQENKYRFFSLTTMALVLSFALYVALDSIYMGYEDNDVQFTIKALAQVQPQQLQPPPTQSSLLYGSNASNTANPPTLHNQNSVSKESNITNFSDGLEALYDKVDQSVVQVTQHTNEPGASRLGSGFIYDSEGHIITNYHVVAGNKINELFDITFIDGTMYRAEIVGVDPFAEIAVLKIIPEEGSEIQDKLVPLKIGNFSDVDVGQRVAAVGNPFGLSASITEGIISGLGRSLPAFSPEGTTQTPFVEEIMPTYSIPNIIQTDAAINPGNSGGPLLNMRGEVIGINTAIFSTTGAYSGVGFAIPSYQIQQVVPALITRGEYQHPYLGISGMDLNTDIAEAMNLENNTGFLVIQVTAGSPAEEAGIQGGAIVTEINGRDVELGGDVIIGVDDKPIRKIDDLLSYLEKEKQVGENINLTIIRNGQVHNLGLTLEARPVSTVLGTEAIQAQGNRPTLGVTGTEMTPEIAQQVKAPPDLFQTDQGFLVIDVLRNGSAEKAGIRGGYISSIINGNQIELGGDIILKIEDVPVRTGQDIRNALSTKQIGDTIQVMIFRDNQTLSLPVTLEPPSADLSEGEIPMVPNKPSPFEHFDPFNNFDEGIYESCSRILGEETCDRLFGTR
ncbi:MAG: trypsin-like peptidase domain-containing protein [Candidatus Nitrosocosmicus sp.]